MKMSNYYNLNSISVILDKFKINNMIISGILDDDVINIILKYVEDNNISIKFIELDKFREGLFLDEFKILHNYDAIFISDDPNWYTLFNELNLIKQNNELFPLVFICHDIYPNKKRDAYINPNVIPEEFRLSYSQDFKLGEINLQDGLYHAIDENTPQNGVSTAIEDFLFENKSIKLLNFNFVNEMKVLYLDDEFTNGIFKELRDDLSNYISNETIDDKIIQNNFLINYMSNLDLNDIPNHIKLKSDFKEYVNKIRIHDYEINYKNSKIIALKSKLGLKDAQIKNFESKLVIAQSEFNNANEKITSLNDEIKSLSGVVSQRDEYISDLSNQIDSLKEDNLEKDQVIGDVKGKLENANNQISLLNGNVDSLSGVVSQRDEYISDLSNQIDSLKEDNLEKDQVIGDVKGKLENANGQINSLNNDLLLKEEIYNGKWDEIKNQIMGFKLELDSLKKYVLVEKENQIMSNNQKISNKDAEINYLKNGMILRLILSPLAYFILIFKSNSKNILTNIKLYRKLKNNDYFDAGFYLNEYPDVYGSKWCKYFSPEFHYVCFGLAENRSCNDSYDKEEFTKELLGDK